ncbi:MAG: hypothetical protein HYY24_09210 [Verrucomicrobia bacterium]|nr:hypothetical protein [Verrucomicrobiota bacterium]
MAEVLEKNLPRLFRRTAGGRFQRLLAGATAWCVAALLVVRAADEKAASPKPATPASESAARPVELRGKVVCLAEAMHERHQTELPTNHAHLFGFKADDGTFYTLLQTKLSEALFLDPRLREKELLLKGRVLPKSQIFDVTSMRSVRDGVVCELYYYCEVCDIVGVSPAPCACCQDAVTLVEKPK